MSTLEKHVVEICWELVQRDAPLLLPYISCLITCEIGG